ncbi:hypothetical protein As57867_010745, partial [Aphanomyces stellatus]
MLVAFAAIARRKVAFAVKTKPLVRAAAALQHPATTAAAVGPAQPAFHRQLFAAVVGTLGAAAMGPAPTKALGLAFAALNIAIDKATVKPGSAHRVPPYHFNDHMTSLYFQAAETSSTFNSLQQNVYAPFPHFQRRSSASQRSRHLPPSTHAEQPHVRFLGNFVLNLCGIVAGTLPTMSSFRRPYIIPSRQDAFYENYFESQRDHIFRSVELLIYVFDIESRELEKDMNHFDGCLEAIEQNSESAKVFVLIHKMDLVPEAQRDAVFDQRKE